MTVDLSFFRSETSQRLRAQGRSEGLVEGRTEGLAQAVLHTLDRRGIAVSADARTRIMSCADSERLLNWLDVATTAVEVDELFRDES
ncbi:hypothetical protein [Nocardia seriolae]|uniref:DUF4351 domain-containing protein n=1 Tax=Nocardia seriolae TaxID=37332 RepID=A0ABC9YTI0_9NOCA|nr:hypothetical protein [Nocardia seriolae]APB00702.1 hypothetical protein NS506_06671 [Nocardia seriolae]WKY50937.1 hypothetical protein Q5P07_28770 [Nocardia seriolae]WNJ57586.1 hypothetical protein RMO66_29885 [Nocardia seriolae]BEK90209.1 hypothetical protein NSERKGN1266_61600 [Nocardia seriolae]BEK93961.1 hypothetical protein NSER024013_18670 [Nocardia seriolae]